MSVLPAFRHRVGLDQGGRITVIDLGDAVVVLPPGSRNRLVADASSSSSPTALVSAIYLEEDDISDINDYVLKAPVHELANPEHHLPVLDGHAPKWAPGERFSYCNGGYVVLALIAEREAGTSFPELVRQCVCQPAGMADTAFLRSDELPGRAAVGYLAVDGLRTNVFHLPVRGSGDGGVYPPQPISTLFGLPSWQGASCRKSGSRR
jgi:CubicO group peptidase (beta-lactamase class C family)